MTGFLKVKTKIAKDMIFYYELHGCEFIEGKMYINTKKFKVDDDGRVTTFYRDCDYLVDRKCKGHGKDKPQICIDFKENGNKDNSRWFIVPGCLANFKKVK